MQTILKERKSRWFLTCEEKNKALGYISYARDQGDGGYCVSVPRGALMSCSQRSAVAGDVVIFGIKEGLYGLIDKPPSLTEAPSSSSRGNCTIFVLEIVQNRLDSR